MGGTSPSAAQIASQVVCLVVLGILFVQAVVPSIRREAVRHRWDIGEAVLTSKGAQDVPCVQLEDRLQ